MIRITLATEVLKNATTVEIYPSSAMENFSLTGGTGYIGKDKFIYTSYIGTTLTGCSEISWSHEAGEEISLFYGMRYRDIIPHVLLMENADPDGIVDAMVEIIDETTTKYLKDSVLDIHKNMDPNRADSEFLELVCGNVGLEYSDNITLPYKRSLARQAVNLLKKRGTEAAFRFLVWYLLGYRVFVDYDPQKVIARMGDQAFRMYTPATPFEISDKTGSYWKFEVIGSLPTTIPNEISTAPELEMANAAMFTVGSMFPKQKALTVGLVHTWAKAPGGAGLTTNLRGKEQFGLSWFCKPDIGGVYPQKLISKDTLIEINRPNKTDLEIKLTDGVTTVTETATNCITEGSNHCVSVLIDRPYVYVVVNGSVQLIKSTFDLDIIDIGGDWVIGDILGVNPYEGRLDVFKIDIGKCFPLKMVDYWEHIKILQTYGEQPDRNAYMLCSTDSKVYITVDYFGEEDSDEKISTLKYLVEEWLTVGSYEILYPTNLPLEKELGWWNDLF
jgi:phage tail-like protein